jgi:hypothetical protein
MTSPTIPHHAPISSAQCVRHQFEPAADRCRTCDQTYCVECLVYALGPDQPPFCMNCALVAGGIRRRGSRAPKVSWRELRRREKEAQAAARMAKLPPPPQVDVDWSVPAPASPAPTEDPAFGWMDEHTGNEPAGRIVAF